MNQYILKQVLAPLADHMKMSTLIQFCAAVEVNRDFIKGTGNSVPFSEVPTLIPYSLKMK